MIYEAEVLQPQGDEEWPKALTPAPLMDRLKMKKAKYEQRLAAVTAAIDLLQADPANETVYAVISAAERGY